MFAYISFFLFKAYYSYSIHGGLLTKKLTEIIKERCSVNSSLQEFNLESLLRIAQNRVVKEKVFIEKDQESEEKEKIIVEAYQVPIFISELKYNIMLNQLKKENILGFIFRNIVNCFEYIQEIF